MYNAAIRHKAIWRKLREPITSALQKAVSRLGYTSLSSQQERVVRSFVGGKDVFANLPTLELAVENLSATVFCRMSFKGIFYRLLFLSQLGSQLFDALQPPKMLGIKKHRLFAVARLSSEVRERRFVEVCKSKEQPRHLFTLLSCHHSTYVHASFLRTLHGTLL